MKTSQFFCGMDTPIQSQFSSFHLLFLLLGYNILRNKAHHGSWRFTEIFTKILFPIVLSCELMICLFLRSLVSNLSKKSQIFQAETGDRLIMQCSNAWRYCLFYIEQHSSEMTYQVLGAIPHHQFYIQPGLICPFFQLCNFSDILALHAAVTPHQKCSESSLTSVIWNCTLNTG